ncbi:MAG: GxxExxY protein [Luteolibacter sp.]
MKTIEETATEIVDSCFKIHKELGSGLLESAYETCLEYELSKRGLTVERQIPQPVIYEDIAIDAGYRIDLLVNGLIIVELKAVEQLAPIHTAQLITYLKLSKKTLGFLINFNTPLIKHGIKRIANNHNP